MESTLVSNDKLLQTKSEDLEVIDSTGPASDKSKLYVAANFIKKLIGLDIKIY